MTLLNILLRQHSILKEVWKILCWRERLKGAYYLIFLSINKRIFTTLEIIEKHNLNSIPIGIKINHKINVIILSKVSLMKFFLFFNINFLFNNLLNCYWVAYWVAKGLFELKFSICVYLSSTILIYLQLKIGS
jgi:hypothetical protein